MKLVFVDDAGFLIKRLWSARLALLGVIWATASGLWLTLPDEWKPTLSEPIRWVLMVFGVALAASPGIAAVLHQPKLAEKVQERAAAKSGDAP